jgi:GNAT superfamily N-acetyltransferase
VPAVKPRRATPAEVPPLAGVLARAFAADPMVVEPMAGGDDLPARIEAMFRLVDTEFAREGWVWTDGGGRGVMVLWPPDAAPREAELTAAMGPRLAPLLADGGIRYQAMWSWIEEHVPREPHWMLDQLAVDPAAQGQGLGRAFLELAIASAEVDGAPVLLETGNERNLALYARFGFRVFAHGDAPLGGPRIWFLRRDPEGRGDPRESARCRVGRRGPRSAEPTPGLQPRVSAFGRKGPTSPPRPSRPAGGEWRRPKEPRGWVALPEALTRRERRFPATAKPAARMA